MQEYQLPVEVNDGRTIAEICKFRAAVWKAIGQLAEGAFSEQGRRDPRDINCQHWIIRDADHRLVAAGRSSVHEKLRQVHQAEEYLRYGLDADMRVAAPCRVVVCPSAQGRGLGRQILDMQDQAAEEAGVVCAVRQASTSMLRLLKHRDWQILGPATTDDRLPDVAFSVTVKWFDGRDRLDVIGVCQSQSIAAT